MSLDSFKRRMADNVPGEFYVGDCCMDCDLCRETAPENFARNDRGGYSYVKKQPETQEEMARCREAMEGCCTNTIYDDGDGFDWGAVPARLHIISRRRGSHRRQHACVTWRDEVVAADTAQRMTKNQAEKSAQPMPGERLRSNRTPQARHGWIQRWAHSAA